MSQNVWVKSGRTFNLTPAAGITTAVPTYGTAVYKDSPTATFQASVTGTGAVTATVVMQVSNEEATYLGTTSNWITLGTITLSGTTTATDGFTTDAPWRYVRAGVTAISGTGATVTSNMGV
tara:strand:+ start:1615 stop:1977 length:363 start_codon:yes stop_codon:yes gene_type:complete